jgi:hypothetical protein
MTFEIRHKRIEAAQAASRGSGGWERVDPYTIRRALRSLHDYF